jgi:hypothetical protein
MILEYVSVAYKTQLNYLLNFFKTAKPLANLKAFGFIEIVVCEEKS